MRKLKDISIGNSNLQDALNGYQLLMERPDFDLGSLRMDFSGTDLSYVDFHGYDLRGTKFIGANLTGCDFTYTNLEFCDFTDASLSRADFHGSECNYATFVHAYLKYASLDSCELCHCRFDSANLIGARLDESKLYSAVLSDAKMDQAFMHRADLKDAVGLPTDLYEPLACPEEGSFIGWKKVYRHTDDKHYKHVMIPVIAKLKILEDSKRSSATGRKCRCDKALVLDIQSLDGVSHYKEAFSQYEPDFVYKVGEIVSVNNFDPNRFEECTRGIHFFITRKEAEEY